MRNIKLVLQYDGTAYSGWQAQREDGDVRTIQGVIERCVSKITGTRPTIHSAGRTDAGVHALGQCVSFKTESAMEIGFMRRALNSVLPRDIRVLAANDVPEDFHPRYAARGKRYRYHVVNMDYIPPFVARYAWHVPYRLDAGAMREACAHFIGQHDFRAFMASGSSVKSTVRTLTAFDLVESASVELMGMRIEGKTLIFEVEGNGFLRHMVRNMVGTVIGVGRGRWEPEEVKEIIASADRMRAGVAAPSCGLFLMGINY